MNSYFITKSLDLGTLREKEKKKILFAAKSTAPGILRVEVSCGKCMKAYHNKGKVVAVEYTPKKVPRHLQSKGSYKVMKSITVVFITGQTEVLTFKAEITK